MGYLKSESTWLRATDNYYFPTTIYRLLAPIATFRIFQRRLTIVDLSLDLDVRALYGIAKQMYLTWNSPWELARSGPAIKYDPYDGQSNGESARVWAWQHILIGQLDQIVDAMVIDDSRGERCIGYGEFFKHYSNPESELRKQVVEPSQIFDGFHPEDRPVLWRILLAQAHFHRALMNSFNSDRGQILHPADAIPWAEWSTFALKARAGSNGEEGEEPVELEFDDADSLTGTFFAVQSYLKERLVMLGGPTSA